MTKKILFTMTILLALENAHATNTAQTADPHAGVSVGRSNRDEQNRAWEAGDFLESTREEKKETLAEMNSVLQEKIASLQSMTDDKVRELLDLEARAKEVHKKIAPERFKRDRKIGGALIVLAGATGYGGVEGVKRAFKSTPVNSKRWTPKTALTAAVLGLSATGVGTGFYLLSSYREDKIKEKAIAELQSIQKKVDLLHRELLAEDKAKEAAKQLLE
jgi:hypothetical protein